MLAGCADGGGPFAFVTRAEGGATEAADGTVPVASGRVVERDIEAPEVFSVADQGLWDGRPSLGGIWVAHPSAKNPERVIVRNESNGKFVVGALFRRESQHPGPKLQVSSDAAAELGLLAGAPAQLNVIALKREEVRPAQPEVVEAAAPVADTAAAEPAALAAGALATGADAAGDVPVAQPAPRQPSKLARFFGIGKKSAETEVAVAPLAAEGEIMTAPLDPVIAGAAAAIDKADKAPKPAAAAAAPKPQQPRAEPAKAAKATDKPVAAAAAPVVAAAAVTEEAPRNPAKLDAAWLQIGIFSVEENAKAAAGRLGGSGVPAEVRQSELNGKPYWRVIAGPAATAADRATLLNKVKSLGFGDAYAVKG